MVALWLGLLWAPPAWAASPASPTAALQTFFERANAIMRTMDPMRGLEEPRQAIREVVNDVIEFRAAAALALGPAWNLKRAEDQDEFVGLFANVLEKGFVAAIVTNASVSGGVKLEYLGESVADDSASVATTLLSRSGNQLPVDYRLVWRGGRWKVQDVVIDGVSLIAKMRGEALEARSPAVAALTVPETQTVRSDAPDVRPPAVVVIVPEVDRRRGDWLDGPRPAVTAILSTAVPDAPSPRWVMGRDGLDAGEEMAVPETPAVRQGHD